MIAKKCIIIHGCFPDAGKAMNPETRADYRYWALWIKEQLTKNDFETQTPLMPSFCQPDYEKFRVVFEKYAVDENTILVGHSCGCAFLVRWLGETKRKISKLILVAPWKVAKEGDEFRKKFYDYSIDESIKERVDQIVMFTADNESADGKESLKIFHNALGGEVVELKGRGHYLTGNFGTDELPELLEKILQ
jgi:predicted alpha/beta hydrolase family esterase